MANKAMKARHWQRIMEVTKYIFELDNEDFCLKNILEAPLLQNKEDIEVIYQRKTFVLNARLFFIH